MIGTEEKDFGETRKKTKKGSIAKSLFFSLSIMIVACSGNQTKNEEMARAKKEQERQYRKEVGMAGSKLYKKKYRKYNCQRLESMQEKTKSRLEKLMDHSDEISGDIGSERKKRLDITLSAIDMAMDTCEDDPALMKKEKEGVTINNENNININNNQ